MAQMFEEQQLLTPRGRQHARLSGSDARPHPLFAGSRTGPVDDQVIDQGQNWTNGVGNRQTGRDWGSLHFATTGPGHGSTISRYIYKFKNLEHVLLPIAC